MKELIIPTMLSLPIATAMGIQSDMEWNERMLDKWGIAFVGLAFTVCLAGWLARRENKAELLRKIREDEQIKERQTREKAANDERIALHTEIRDLNRQQLEQGNSHSKRLEQLVKDGNKAQADVGVELKNLARRVRCPGSSHDS